MTSDAPPLLSRVGKFAALVVALCALAHLALATYALTTTSLTTDEFGTIFSYSARGPWHVMTDYDAPKNHIFFNLLNSVTPGRESIAPARARLYSVLATLGIVVVMAVYGSRTGRWLEAAAWMAAWAATTSALEMGLLARGYGLLALAAAFSCLAAERFFTTRDGRWLIALAVTTVLGTYTVPGYLFFGAPLLLAVWALDRTRRSFFAGVGAALGILLLYSPVLFAVLGSGSGYGAKYESDFQRWGDIIRAVRVYGLPGSNTFHTLWILAAGLPFLVASPTPINRALRVVAFATFAAFGILLALKTPPLRMAAFIMVPLAFCVVGGAGEILRRCPWRGVATAFGIALALWLALFPARQAAAFRYVPLENWSDAAALIDAAFPVDVAVDYGRNGKYLRHYLAPERVVRKDAAADLATSRVLIVDAHRRWVNATWNTTRTFSARAQDPRGIELVAPGGWRDIYLNFAAPRLERIPAPDGRNWSARYPVEGPTHAAVLTYPQPLAGVTAEAEFTPQAGGPSGKIRARVIGNAVIVPLAGQPPGELAVRIFAAGAPNAAALIPAAQP